MYLKPSRLLWTSQDLDHPSRQSTVSSSGRTRTDALQGSWVSPCTLGNPKHLNSHKWLKKSCERHRDVPTALLPPPRCILGLLGSPSSFCYHPKPPFWLPAAHTFRCSQHVPPLRVVAYPLKAARQIFRAQELASLTAAAPSTLTARHRAVTSPALSSTSSRRLCEETSLGLCELLRKAPNALCLALGCRRGATSAAHGLYCTHGQSRAAPAGLIALLGNSGRAEQCPARAVQGLSLHPHSLPQPLAPGALLPPHPSHHSQQRTACCRSSYSTHLLCL